MIRKQRNEIIVTTGDLRRDYEVLGPVYFQISNKGIFSSTLGTLKRQYFDEIQRMKDRGTMSADRMDWGFLYGEWSVGQNDFEAAFYIATEEIKKRAIMVGADAVICMRQDIDLDTNGFAFFYLQMYGTAVKFIDADPQTNNVNHTNNRFEESTLSTPKSNQSKNAEKPEKEEDDFDGWTAWDGINPEGKQAVYLRPSTRGEFFGICPKCGTQPRLSRHNCWQCGIPFMYSE